MPHHLPAVPEDSAPRGDRAGRAGSAQGGLGLPGRIEAVREAIASACARAGRRPQDVRLIAATKSVPADVVLEAREAGIEDFGENYAAELATKAALVGARWHFLGRLQRGTAARVAEVADVVHSAEPGHGLERLARSAARAGRTIDCMAQVDFTGLRQGVEPEPAVLAGFIDRAGQLEGIRMVGLMTLPPVTPSAEAARPYFVRLRELRDRLGTTLPGLVELSMGMSFDYPVAVEEGATMVRVGR